MTSEEYIVQRCLKLERENNELESNIKMLEKEFSHLSKNLDDEIDEFDALKDFLQKYGEKCKILTICDESNNHEYDFISFGTITSKDADYDEWLKLLGLTGEPNA